MLTCTNCGNERPEGTRFCGNCGTPFVQADQQASPAEPQPIASSSGKRRLRWVAVAAAAALLVAGGAVAAIALTGDDEPSQAEVAEILESLTTPTEPDLFGDTTDTTDFFGDTTDTTDSSGTPAVIGQGVDETCEDLLAFARLAKESGFGRGVVSVDDLERAAAAASTIASKAPAESAETSYVYAGEPRASLERLAQALGTYVGLLSELGLEPGPDALLEPRIAEATSDADNHTSTVFEWFAYRCSQEDVAELQEITG